MRNPEERTPAHVVGAGFQPARPPRNPAAPTTADHPHAAKRPRCRPGATRAGFKPAPTTGGGRPRGHLLQPIANLASRGRQNHRSHVPFCPDSSQLNTGAPAGGPDNASVGYFEAADWGRTLAIQVRNVDLVGANATRAAPTSLDSRIRRPCINRHSRCINRHSRESGNLGAGSPGTNVAHCAAPPARGRELCKGPRSRG